MIVIVERWWGDGRGYALEASETFLCGSSGSLDQPEGSNL
jgi:hypothetical protein